MIAWTCKEVAGLCYSKLGSLNVLHLDLNPLPNFNFINIWALCMTLYTVKSDKADVIGK